MELPRLDAGEVEVTLAWEVRVRSGFVETAPAPMALLSPCVVFARHTTVLTA